jgi:hypothetical protein
MKRRDFLKAAVAMAVAPAVRPVPGIALAVVAVPPGVYSFSAEVCLTNTLLKGEFGCFENVRFAVSEPSKFVAHVPNKVLKRLAARGAK